jgi:hypothetical protein
MDRRGEILDSQVESRHSSQLLSHSELTSIGAGALFFIALGSFLAFTVTQVRCDTSPQDDTGWHFSNYCTALHSLHVVNFPDSVSGGGVLEGIFVLPILVTIGGMIFAIRARRFGPLLRALSVAGFLVALLFVLAVVFASATYPGGP